MYSTLKWQKSLNGSDLLQVLFGDRQWKGRQGGLNSSVHVCVCPSSDDTQTFTPYKIKCHVSQRYLFFFPPLTFSLSLTLLVSVYLSPAHPPLREHWSWVGPVLSLCTERKPGAKTQMVSKYLKKTGCSSLTGTVWWEKKSMKTGKSHTKRRGVCVWKKFLLHCTWCFSNIWNHLEPQDRNTMWQSEQKQSRMTEKRGDFACLVNMHSVKKRKRWEKQHFFFPPPVTENMLKNTAFTKHEAWTFVSGRSSSSEERKGCLALENNWSKLNHFIDWTPNVVVSGSTKAPWVIVYSWKRR